jgi:hypothetical protein
MPETAAQLSPAVELAVVDDVPGHTVVPAV